MVLGTRKTRVDRSASTARPGGVVGVLAAAGIVASLMQTLVVPLLGDLPRILDTSASNASWVVTVTLLTGAVSTPVAGRLGDLYGKRAVLLGTAVPLVAGSVVCALASSLLPMVVGRGLQGLGIGMIPVGISALRDLLPPARLGPSIALMSASMGVGGAVGLPVSAAVAEHLSWRVLFWAAAVLGALVMLLMWRFVPAVPVSGGGGRFDAVGAAGLGAGLVCLLLAISKGGDWGWAGPTTVGLFAAAAVVLAAWGAWELRTGDPLVDLRVAAGRQVLLTNVASVALGLAMYAQMLIVPQLLQLPSATGYGLGQSMLAMGLWMAPAGLMMMLVSPLGAALSAARGPKITLAVGSVVTAGGYGALQPLMGSTWGLALGSCICTAGVGLAYGAMPALIMGAVPVSETASANSFNTLMRSIGTTTSAAVVGVILAQMSVQAGGHSVPTEGGFRAGMVFGAVMALLAALVALTIPARRPVAVPGQRSAPDTVHAARRVRPRS